MKIPNKSKRSKLLFIAVTLVGIFLVPLLPVTLAKESNFEEQATIVVLTFDDGRKSWVSNIVPILSRYDLVATGFINSPDFLSDFTWDDVHALYNAGWEIGWHTSRHINLRNASRTAITDDFNACQSLFYDHGLPVPASFAYPWGKYDQKSVEIVAEYFQAARTIGRGVNWPSDVRDNPYQISSFKLKHGVSFVKDTVNKHLGQGVLIVFMGHSVGLADTREPELSDEEFDIIAQFLYEKKNNGEIDIVTFGHGIQLLKQREHSYSWRIKLESPVDSWEEAYGIRIPYRYIEMRDSFVRVLFNSSYVLFNMK